MGDERIPKPLPMPALVDESLTPCPKRHWLVGLCVRPIDHEGDHAVWRGRFWDWWTDEQCSEFGVIVCENIGGTRHG